MFTIGQKVITKYGSGKVCGFEDTGSNSFCSYPNVYHDGCRIQVQLDKPENWPLHTKTKNAPFFVEGDLS
jgi:hypothetical protein